MSTTTTRFCIALFVTLANVLAAPRIALADPPASHPSGHPAAVASSTAPAPEGVVNVNAATEDELMRLPGIGPSRAHAITTLRERVHQFGHAEDLMRVRGIGRVGFRRMRPFISLSGPTTLANRPGRPVRADASSERDGADNPSATMP